VVSTNLRQPRSRGFPWGTVIVLVLCGGGAVAVGLWAFSWVQYWYQQGAPGEAHSAGIEADYNCHFDFPGGQWKSDEVVKKKMEANLGLTRHSPTSHLALFWKDYKDRSPSEGELLEVALSRLRKYLGTAVEWERKSAGDASRLGGQPALHIEYVGPDPENVIVNGECLILAYRGYAYWLFTWGPEAMRDQIAPEWRTLREGFSLLNKREGWKEKPREKEVLAGPKGGYELTFPSDLWKKKPAEEENDPAVEVVLEAFDIDKKEKVHASRAAHLYVMVLSKAADLKAAVAAAREQLSKRLEDAGHGKVEITTVKEKGVEIDRDADIGALRGRFLRLHVQAEDSNSFERFYQLGVVQRPDNTLVLLGDCPWERREFGGAEFSLIFQGLKAR